MSVSIDKWNHQTWWSLIYVGCLRICHLVPIHLLEIGHYFNLFFLVLSLWTHLLSYYGLHSKFHYECEVVFGIINDSFTSCVGSHANLAITTFWEAIVCPKDTHYKWHAWDCMFGTCKDCGVDNLALYPNEEENTLFAIVCWKCFSMEKVVIKKGEEKINKNSCIYWKLIPWSLLHFEA